MKTFIHLASGLLLTAVLSCCSHRGNYRFEEGIAWNTIYHITYESSLDLSDSIRIVLSQIDGSLSPFNPSSTVSKINANLTDSVDSHFMAVYNESLQIHTESEGAFDPTLAPLIRAWGFGQGHSATSDTLRLDSLMQFVGIGKTAIAGADRLTKENPAIEFNFSALAKGYGVDCIADMLLRNGVTNFLVEVGGEIRAQGLNHQGNEWVIGIEKPLDMNHASETVLNIRLDNGAVATSGNYRNYQEQGGRRYGHTISPATGRPVQTDVISATVIAPTCMEADALATCAMVMGSEEALSLCARMRAGVMLIKDDLTVMSNPVFRSFCEFPTGQSGEPGTADPD